MNRHMGKPTICIGKNKGADQLLSNCEADQRLCFHYTDCTIPLLPKYEISCFLLLSFTVHPVCVRPGRKPQRWFSHEAGISFKFLSSTSRKILSAFICILTLALDFFFSLARLHEVHRAIVVTSVVRVYVYVHVRVRVTLSVKVFKIVIS